MDGLALGAGALGLAGLLRLRNHRQRSVFVFGLGYTGTAFAAACARAGHRVAGTVRRPEELQRAQRTLGPAVHVFVYEPGVAPLDVAARAALRASTHLLSTVQPVRPAAGTAADPVLGDLGDGTGLALAAPSARWVGYLSTTAVYGDHGGSWVDESPTTVAEINLAVTAAAVRQGLARLT